VLVRFDKLIHEMHLIGDWGTMVVMARMCRLLEVAEWSDGGKNTCKRSPVTEQSMRCSIRNVGMYSRDKVTMTEE
jgi:hypothetical protein